MINKCYKCDKDIFVEDNPSTKTEGHMIVKIGKHRRRRLCSDCWCKARKIPCPSKGKKFPDKLGNNGGYMDLESPVLGHSKVSKDAIFSRNKEIKRLRILLTEIFKENSRLKDEIICLKIGIERLK